MSKTQGYNKRLRSTTLRIWHRDRDQYEFLWSDEDEKFVVYKNGEYFQDLAPEGGGSADLGNYEFTGDTMLNDGNIAIHYDNGTDSFSFAGNVNKASILPNAIDFPNLDIAEIDAAGGKSAVTKEWVEANAGAGDVQTVNGQSPDGAGNVEVDADEVDDSTTNNKFVSSAEKTKIGDSITEVASGDEFDGAGNSGSSLTFNGRIYNAIRSFFSTISADLLTASRLHALPDKDGIFAMLDDTLSSDMVTIPGSSNVVLSNLRQKSELTLASNADRKSVV